MKKLIILTLCLALTMTVAIAQKTYLSIHATQTIAGLQKGAELGFSSPRLFAIGAFYQSTELFQFESGISNYPFYGMKFQFPIKANCNGLALLGNLQAGLVNNQFIVITPQLETQIKLYDWLALASTVGIRAGHAAVGARLIIQL